MYCPYCAQKLAIINGQPYCIAGDMYLSQNLATAIGTLIQQSPAVRHQESSTMTEASRWFCPRCQQQMSTAAQNTLAQECHACGLLLTSRVMLFVGGTPSSPSNLKSMFHADRHNCTMNENYRLAPNTALQLTASRTRSLFFTRSIQRSRQLNANPLARNFQGKLARKLG